MPESESPSETIGQSGIDARAVTVSALTRALSAGQLSSVDLVRHYLGQITARNGDLGAVITTTGDALDQAEA
ncbi:MAG: hypothetical protein ACYCPF_11635, partial [Streptosporangiaceae bacterium]